MAQIELLIIDPQNDFSDTPEAALRVPGATADGERLAKLIARLSHEIDDIHVTLDTHQLLDIAHPLFWVDSRGEHPEPFTQISLEAVQQGRWRPFNPQFQERCAAYVQALRDNGRYDLTIWPPHCLVGSWGHNVMAPIAAALWRWEREHYGRVNYVTKGHNPWTEHYSAIQADVPDPNDATTQLNVRLIDTLARAEVVLLSGQALSHCVANTVRDIADNISADAVAKLVLLEDTSSPVPGFETFATQFVSDLKRRGMQTALAADFTP